MYEIMNMLNANARDARYLLYRMRSFNRRCEIGHRLCFISLALGIRNIRPEVQKKICVNTGAYF